MLLRKRDRQTDRQTDRQRIYGRVTINGGLTVAESESEREREREFMDGLPVMVD